MTNPKTYTPKEFAAALADHGVTRSERWVANRCPKTIRTLPAFRPRHVIPHSELLRVLGLLRNSQPASAHV